MPNSAAMESGKSRYSRKQDLALDQEIALASLDPRCREMNPREGNQRLGVSTTAVADESSLSVPSQGIGVSRDWRMYSE